MDIVREFFAIKKNYILSYCTILCEHLDIEKKEEFLKEFVDTYVDSYYLETFGTIKNKSYFEVKPKDITEELKATNQLEWVQKMNAIKNSVEEIIFRELIYC